MCFVAAVKFSELQIPPLFTMEGLELAIGEYVVADYADRARVGLVAAFETLSPDMRKLRQLNRIVRKATPDEVESYRQLKDREQRALRVARERSLALGLGMKIATVDIDDVQRKAVFNFSADKRVDFRELVRELAAELKMRIELWQIGVRDEARKIDGFSTCGQRFCCSNWLAEFTPVSIKMARAQDMNVAPSKLAGMCGRLKCCLQYEHATYVKLSKGAPVVGAEGKVGCGGECRTTDGTCPMAAPKLKCCTGKIVERNLIKGEVVILDGGGHRHTAPFSAVRTTGKGGTRIPPPRTDTEDDEAEAE
jgi:cell fate regulator YaaT (PSP1 superfamily)